MLPERMRLSVIRRTRGQFNTIKSLFRRADLGEVIIATDAGREGELVARWIMRLGGWKGPYRRLWISSQTDSAIREGFAKLKPGKTQENLFRAAECRAEADWIVGLNVSRGLSCKYDARLSAGRVQTPVLNLIALREKEIEGFVPVPFWTVQADFGSFTGTWQNEKGNQRITNEQLADEISARIRDGAGHIVSVKRRKKSSPPPAAYDLTSLQRDANNLLGFSARKTLQVLQNLYERHKYLTYPRTDSRHVTQDVAETLPERFKALIETPFGATAKAYLKTPPVPGKRFIDGKKVSDHHAIIPTEESVDLKRMNGDERSLWTMVVRRFLAVLASPYIYESLEVKVEVNGEVFAARGTDIIDHGFRRIESYTGDDDIEISGERQLGVCKEGQKVSVKKTLKKGGFTKPPARYTEGTLLGAMENPGRFIEDSDLKASIAKGGLGTPATRAEIIEKLLSSYYIERRGKELHPTTRGIELLELVPEQLKSPALTAQWEQRLSKIERGEEKSGHFSKNIRESTKLLIGQIKASAAEYKPKNTTGKSCPLCGKPLMAIRSKGEELLVCHSLSCGYEEETAPRGAPRGAQRDKPGRPSKRERDTARRYMHKFKAGGETTSFADLIRAADERKKNDS
jgi:DNA topoisomerase-3